jgi:hypothetical protein
LKPRKLGKTENLENYEKLKIKKTWKNLKSRKLGKT